MIFVKLGAILKTLSNCEKRRLTTHYHLETINEILETLVLWHLKLYMSLQNTLNFLHDFRKLVQNCSRSNYYLLHWYLLTFFKTFAQNRWVLMVLCKILHSFSREKFQVFGATRRIYRFRCQSPFDAEQNPKKLVKLRKFLNSEVFPETNVKKSDRKKASDFLTFPEIKA